MSILSSTRLCSNTLTSLPPSLTIYSQNMHIPSLSPLSTIHLPSSSFAPSSMPPSLLFLSLSNCPPLISLLHISLPCIRLSCLILPCILLNVLPSISPLTPFCTSLILYHTATISSSSSSSVSASSKASRLSATSSSREMAVRSICPSLHRTTRPRASPLNSTDSGRLVSLSPKRLASSLEHLLIHVDLIAMP